MEHSASAPTVGPSQAKSGAVDGSGAGGGAGSSGMIKSGSVATLQVKPGRVRGISFAKWAARRQKKRTQDAAWSEVWDEEQQVSYFYNSVTHETAWFDPRSTALAAAGTVIPDDDAANEGGHYDAAGYTENGFCPKPTLLGLARAEIEYEEKQAAEMEKQVDWVRGELLQFEQQKQAELQAEIQQLQDELERSGDRDDDLSGMLTAFGNITAAHDERKEQNRGKNTIDAKLEAVWDAHEEAVELHQGAQLLERERQRAKLQERLEAREKKRFAKRLAEIDKQLAAKRKEAGEKIANIRGQFQGAVFARQRAMAQLRKLAVAVPHRPKPEQLDPTGEHHHVVEEHVEGYTPWVELWCEDTGHKYWYNHDTGAAQWYPPEGWTDKSLYHTESPDAAEGHINAAVALAEEWVSQDQLEAAQARTAELEQLAAEMRAEVAKTHSMSAHDLLGLLEGFMELENEEDNVKDQADVLYQDMVAERNALDQKMGEERERQKKKLAERIERKRAAALARKKRRVEEQAKAKAVQAEKLTKQVRVSANIAKRHAWQRATRSVMGARAVSVLLSSPKASRS